MRRRFGLEVVERNRNHNPQAGPGTKRTRSGRGCLWIGTVGLRLGDFRDRLRSQKVLVDVVLGREGERWTRLDWRGEQFGQDSGRVQVQSLLLDWREATAMAGGGVVVAAQGV